MHEAHLMAVRVSVCVCVAACSGSVSSCIACAVSMAAAAARATGEVCACLLGGFHSMLHLWPCTAANTLGLKGLAFMHLEFSGDSLSFTVCGVTGLTQCQTSLELG